MNRSDEHRAIYCRLLDDPDFQALSADEQRVWFFLRLAPECGPTGLFRFYPGLHRERMRMDEISFEAAVAGLESSGWVIREAGYILLVHAMRFEPGFKPQKDQKHLRNVWSHVASLGKLKIARKLLADEGLEGPPEWSAPPQRRASEGPAKALRSTGTVTGTVTGTEHTPPTAPLPAKPDGDTTLVAAGAPADAGGVRVKPQKGDPAIMAQFAAWYESYPRHEARADAEKAWRSLRPDQREQCIALTPVWIAARSHLEQRFLPLPASYLRGARWTDDPPPPGPTLSPGNGKPQVQPKPEPLELKWAREDAEKRTRPAVRGG
jgi:hypothetical protein